MRCKYLVFILFFSFFHSKIHSQQWFHKPHWQYASKAVCDGEIEALDIIADNAGRQWLTGFYVGNANFNGIQLQNKSTQLYYDIFLAINENGIWKQVKTFGGESAEIGRSLAKDSAGDIYLLSTFFSDSIRIESKTFYNKSNTGDILLLKFKPNGSLIWAKQFGGDGWDEGYSMVIDSDNHIWIGGDFNSRQLDLDNYTLSVSDTFGNSDAFLFQIDTSGKVLWAKSYYSGFNETLWKLSALPSGKIVAAFVSDGYEIYIPPFSIINFKSENFLGVISSSGITEWAKAIETTGTCDIATNKKGDIIFNSPFFPDSINVDGKTIHSRLDIGWKGTNLFASFHEDGSLNWVRTNFSDYYLNYTRLFCPDTNTIMIYGNPQGDLGSQIAVGDSIFHHDHIFYFAKASVTDGHMIWRAENDNSNYSTESLAACINPDGNFSIAGTINLPGNIKFGDYSVGYNNNDKLYMMYLAKFNDSMYRIPPIDSPKVNLPAYTVYPNPVKNECNIIVNDSAETWHFSIYSSDGKNLLNHILHIGLNTFSFDEFEEGIYFSVINDDEKNNKFHQKILKIK